MTRSNGQPQITVAAFPSLTKRRQISNARTGAVQPLWSVDDFDTSGAAACRAPGGFALLIEHVVEGLAHRLTGGEPYRRSLLQLSGIGPGQALSLNLLSLKRSIARIPKPLPDIHVLVIPNLPQPMLERGGHGSAGRPP